MIHPVPGLTFTHKRFLNPDRSHMRMRITRVTSLLVYFTCADDGKGSWMLGRADWAQTYGQEGGET